MIVSDFLSRQKHDDNNPHEIIHISFNIHSILQERYYDIGFADRYLVQMQLQTKFSGIKLLEVHSMKKNLKSSSLQEKQKIAPPLVKGTEIKPRLGKRRAGIKCKKPQAQLTEKIQEMLKIPATWNIAKNRMDFPMHKQSISNPNTETITQGTIQNIESYISVQTWLIGLLISWKKIYECQG